MRRVIKVIIYIVSLVFATFYFGIVVGKNKDVKIDKYKKYFELMCELGKISDSELEKYFANRNISCVGIYGKGDLGKYLCDVLKKTKINVVFFVQRTSSLKYRNIPAYDIDSELPLVDAIIITPFLEFEEIEKDLKKRVGCKIVSIEDLLVI